MVDDLSKAQIGASGTLLIQYQLLKCGIESAPMTTDAGIDLVVYSPKLKEALTVQVKTCLKPKRAGGNINGRLALDWWLPSTSPAQLVGCVNLADDDVWLFRKDEFRQSATQTQTPNWHLSLYVEPDHFPQHVTPHVRDFERFRLEGRIIELFGSPQSN